MVYCSLQWQNSMGRSGDGNFPPPPPPEQLDLLNEQATAASAALTPLSPLAASPSKSTSSKRADDASLPWPQDVHQSLCQALDSIEHGWMLLCEHFEKMGVSFSWRKSLRRKSRNSADTVIRRLYGEKPVEVANTLLLDSLCAMRCTELLELLLPYAGLPRTTAPHVDMGVAGNL